MIYPSAAPSHPDTEIPGRDALQPPLRSLLARLPPGPAHRQQKREGRRAAPPRHTAALGQSHGSIPGQSGGKVSPGGQRHKGTRRRGGKEKDLGPQGPARARRLPCAAPRPPPALPETPRPPHPAPP